MVSLFSTRGGTGQPPLDRKGAGWFPCPDTPAGAGIHPREAPMHPRLPLGTQGVCRIEVGEEHTAHAMGNTGVKVLATPMVAWLFECAATDALRPAMRPGEISVGTVINVRHLHATPVGLLAACTVTLRAVKGVRYLFDAVVTDPSGVAAEGEIERAILDGARFFRKLEERKPPRPA